MVLQDVRSLLARLDRDSARILDSAVGACACRGHREVGIPHLLFAIREDGEEGTDLLAAAGIDSRRLDVSLREVLAGLREAGAVRPSFAPSLVALLERAWLEASLNLSERELAPRALLLALPGCRHLLPPELRELVASAPSHALRMARPRRRELGKEPDQDEPLLRYAVDLVEEARQGRLDPVPGRDAEIRQVLDVLSRRRKNNPILLGEAGVGKTAVVEGLALRIAAGDVPQVLRAARVLALDLGLLAAGAGVRGEFERRLKALVSRLRASPVPAILFVDEAHALVGTGGEAGSTDAANLLKPELARGGLRCVAATTFAEYRRHLEKDPAIARRFQPIVVAEPSPDAAAAMIGGVVGRYEEFHGVEIPSEAVVAACELSHRYVPERQLPDKAIDLLDTAAARCRSQAVLSEKIPRLTHEALSAVVEEWTGIPAQRLLRDEAAALLDLEGALGRRVLGQPLAVRELAATLCASRMGLTRPETPRGVFLLVGPSGTGKTEAAKAVADLLYGGEACALTLNLSEYRDPASLSQLKGASAGYVGYGDGGVLTEAVRRRPHCAVILEEVEKAHRDVLNFFYQVFDQGRLRDGEGRDVSFRDAVVLMTSNLGAGTLVRLAADGQGGDIDWAEAIRPELAEYFRPALLARCKVIPFLPLGREARREIAREKLRRLACRLEAQHGVELDVAEGIVERLAGDDGGRHGGARRIDALLDREVLPGIVQALLARLAQGGAGKRLEIVGGADGMPELRIDGMAVA